MKRWILAALAALVLLPLAGCWDARDVENTVYAMSVGMDYKDGKYELYVQAYDFTTVAKTLGQAPPELSAVWVGHATGKTPLSAFNFLYRTTQMRIFFGQVNSLILTENLLKKGAEDFLNAIRRYYEFRYTPWVFGTKDSLKDVYEGSQFFNLSPLMSTIYQPMEQYRQFSRIRPITFREFISYVEEPGKTLLLPSITMLTGFWTGESQKTSKQPSLSGAFVLSGWKYKGWVRDLDVRGLRWMEPKTNRSPLIIEFRDKDSLVVYPSKPKVQIRARMKNGEPYFTVRIRAAVRVGNMSEADTREEIERLAAQKMEEEIRKAYEKGLEMGADLLGLEDYLYRKRNRDWKRLRREGGLELRPESLEKVEVSVIVENAGKLKF